MDEPAAPNMFGPYVVDKPVGRGGMGVVYQGHDPNTHERVAIKTVQSSSPRDLMYIRREIHALTRIRHRGVVRIRSQGVQSGVPWYAMDYVDGTGLHTYVADIWQAAGEHTDSSRRAAAAGKLRDVIAILYRLATILTAVHRAGIVHRDLKPSNVLVTAGEQPILVDFGLVQRNRGSRDVLEADHGSIVGTALYMAPEQFSGEVVDARADLYAFGCILYECLTGQPPFRGAHYMELVRLHLFSQPRPASELVDGIPPALTELLSRLLAKRPQLRPGHASEILHTLRGIWPDLDPDWELHSGLDLAFTPYRPALAGRARELETLRGHLERMLRGNGSFVLLEGTGGSGKTRLLVELLRLARQQRCTIVTSEPMPVSVGGVKRSQATPLHALLGLLRTTEDLCRRGTAVDTRQIFGEELGIIAPFLPSLLTLPGADTINTVPPLPTEGARMRLVEAMVRIIERTIKSDALVLVLDDLQWADDLSIAVLDGLARRNLGTMRLLVIGSVRTDALSEHRMQRLRHIAPTRLRLHPLGASELAGLVSDMLCWSAPPDNLLDAMVDVSSGSPLYATEYVHWAVESGYLRRRLGSWSFSPDYPAQPQSIGELLLARIQLLSLDARHTLECAAIVGGQIEAELLANLCELDEPRFLSALDDLLNRQLLQSETETHLLQFAHDSLREQTYEAIPRTRRKALHHAVATLLEREPPSPFLSSTLAHHWERGGVRDRALKLLIQAAQRAVESGAAREALALTDRIWQLCEPGELPRFDLTMGQRRTVSLLSAKAAWGVSEIDLCERHARTILRHDGIELPSTRPAWAFRLLAAGIRQMTRHLFGRPVARQQALPPTHPTQLRHMQVQALILYMQCKFSRNQILEMLATCFVSANAAEDAQLSPSITYSIIGATAGSMKLRRARDYYFRRSHACAHATQNDYAIVSTRVSEASCYMAAADWSRFDNSITQGQAVAIRIGALTEACALAGMASNAALLREGPHRALELAEANTANLRHHSNAAMLAWSLLTEAECALLLGDLERAHAATVEARPILEHESGVTARANADGLLAALAYCQGDLEAAQHHATITLRGLQAGMPLAFHRAALCYGATTWLLLHKHAGQPGSRQAYAWRELGRKMRATFRLLQRTAKRSPLLETACLRLRAKRASIRGAALRAENLYQRAAVRASTHGLQLEAVVVDQVRAVALRPYAPRRADACLRHANARAQRLNFRLPPPSVAELL